MIKSTLAFLLTAFIANSHESNNFFVGIIQTNSVFPEHTVKFMSNFVGPFKSKETCEVFSKKFAVLTDESINEADTTFSYVKSVFTCSNNDAAIKIYKKVVVSPGKFYFDSPYITFELSDFQLSCAVIYHVGMTKELCMNTAHNINKESASSAAKQNIKDPAFNSKCYMPNKSLPEMK